MKTLWVDVGTHRGQELRAIFGGDSWFYWKILKFLIRGLLSSARKRNTPTTRDGLSLKRIGRLLKQRRLIRSHPGIVTILIEPNRHLLGGKMYRKATHVFPLALTEDLGPSPRIIKLFHANHDHLGQGSSVYSEKKNISTSDFQLVTAMSARVFFSGLDAELGLSLDPHRVVLRLNCEGAEDTVIYSAIQTFGARLQLLAGSLKDVEEIKGPSASDRLAEFISEKGIEFVEFSESVESWFDAFESLERLFRFDS